MNGYTLVIDCDPGENEAHHFDTKEEALDYLHSRYTNLGEEGFSLRSRGMDKVADFTPETSTGRYDVWIEGSCVNGVRPVIWPERTKKGE